MVAWLGLGAGLTLSGIRIVMSNLSWGGRPPAGHTPMVLGLVFLALGAALLASARTVLDLLPR